MGFYLPPPAGWMQVSRAAVVSAWGKKVFGFFGTSFAVVMAALAGEVGVPSPSCHTLGGLRARWISHPTPSHRPHPVVMRAVFRMRVVGGVVSCGVSSPAPPSLG
jgi:hypothetical protein